MPTPPRIARARRDKRAKKAKAFINKIIPTVLRSNARARAGVQAACLVIDPAKDCCACALPSMSIALHATDTLGAAYKLSEGGDSRVAILSMASPLRPGGGVLTGATSQEEGLCGRTTLYPSLREDFYRLPDVGGVYTPDVLVVRDADGVDLPREKRFFVDVITSAMLRMPDLQGGTYAEERDKEMVVRKMRAVLRMARATGVTRLVLGAWGCGGYGNPVKEVARAWNRVLCGTKTRTKDNGSMLEKERRRQSRAEGWDGLQVVFAIKERSLAEVFAAEFETDILEDEPAAGEEDDSDYGQDAGGCEDNDQADDDETEDDEAEGTQES